MIKSIKSDEYGFIIEGCINLKDDMTAREIYERIYKEIQDINFAAIVNGGDNIEYTDTKIERD